MLLAGEPERLSNSALGPQGDPEGVGQVGFDEVAAAVGDRADRTRAIGVIDLEIAGSVHRVGKVESDPVR